MRQRITLIVGIFAVMALSNAIVPVLPAFGQAAPAVQGAIFSAYFFGAFLTVLPAGMLADRIGKVPLIRAGLLLTLLSGCIMTAVPLPVPVLAARGLEGIGAGLFVASALSWVNAQRDHRLLSGYFIAALNFGLLAGLLGTGWLEAGMGATGGILLFTVLSALPLLMGIALRETENETLPPVRIVETLRDHFWLYISAVVLVGVTGVVTTLYPEFTGHDAALLSIEIGMMNTATIVTSILAPRFMLEPVRTMRISAIGMAIAVACSLAAPNAGTAAVIAAFAMIGGIAGFIINAQLAYLAATRVQQGTLMGLFNTATYAGMTLLPFTAGIIAQFAGFPAAFLVMAGCAAVMAVTIGWCRCRAVPSA
ncbi:MAG: MFS transporter [Methanomicrobiales archaeon]|nr:MFS transporter [Methanomicrobiales archaeon]